MSDTTGERLYELLPVVHRVRDVAHGEPLRALLAVIERELRTIEADVEGLYDNWFIETCAEWVVPYIGDLLGTRHLIPVEEGTFSQRALVANTLAYRRRKGTAAMLEQLARDVTGWPAKVVEFFGLLATTQHVNHVRPANRCTLDLRDTNSLELLNGPFERAAHTAEVRHVDNGRGKYNIPNIGIYLWRLQSYALEAQGEPPDLTVRASARAVSAATEQEAGRYTFSPLGQDGPLFNRPRTETEITQLAEEVNVPGPLRRRPLRDELEARRQALVDDRTPRGVYFGDEPVLRIFVGDDEVPADRIAICNLSDPPTPLPEGWRRPATTRTYTPSGGGSPESRPIDVAVDPALGRIAFPVGVVPDSVEVGYAYGFSGDLGGGPYDRRESLQAVLTRPVVWQRGVTRDAPGGQSRLVATLAEAVEAWNDQPPGTVGAIALLDSRTYPESVTGAGAITIPAGSQLTIVAADWPEEESSEVPGQMVRRPGRLAAEGRRPHLQGSLEVRGTAAAESVEPGTLVVDGLLVEGGLTVRAGNLGNLRLAHSTLVPGLGGLTVEAEEQPGSANERLAVTLERSICGAITLAETVPTLRIEESILDAGEDSAIDATATEVESSTILGSSTVRSLEASNSIFAQTVRVSRRQSGCVRFCYLPLDSLAPRRFRCQPANAAAASRVFPRFTSIDYGQPGYGQLAPSCPGEISAGADDEGEMGAFHFLQQTQRVANLRASLDEYLRFGMEAGIFFVT